MTDAVSLPLVDAALRGALVATLALLGAALWKEHSAHPVARVGMALLAGLAVQAFSGTPSVEQGLPVAWQAPLVGVSVGNSALFWLFARALFDDDFSPGARQVALWAAVVAIGASFCLSMAAFGPHAVPTRVAELALRWTPACFAALVIVAAVSQWRGDLVERRRRVRGFIVVAGAAYTAAMVVLRLAAPHGRLSAVVAGFDTAALLLIMGVVAAAVLKLSDGGLLPPPADAAPMSTPAAVPAPAAAPPDEAEQRLAQALQQLMAGERGYRVDDLTLGLLALKLGVPEYRLRRHINQRLGHRNFNAYVNAFRLEQARAALADPDQRDASVLEIAMDAGFASIGPFNRAFKAAHGATPSEFRRQALADS